MWIGNDKQLINSYKTWKPAFVCLIINRFKINKPLVDYSIFF